MISVISLLFISNSALKISRQQQKLAGRLGDLGLVFKFAIFLFAII
jgi:hypothetical protein